MIRPFESEYLDERTWVVYTRCPECGRTNCLEVTPQQLSELEFAAEHPSEGKLIQNILTDHSSSEREYLLSGYCNDCWNKIFGGMLTEAG
jgi:hypothetical protein